MKHLLFFLIFIIIANNNLHAYPNKNENIYNYKFSVLELFLKKYYPPAGESGRSGVLLLLSPLRTVRASFPAYGSSF